MLLHLCWMRPDPAGVPFALSSRGNYSPSDLQHTWRLLFFSTICTCTLQHVQGNPVGCVFVLPGLTTPCCCRSPGHLLELLQALCC